MRSLVVLIVLVQFASAADYHPQLSQVYQKYTIITHCSYEELMNWSCKICNTLQKFENTIYLENKIAAVMAYMGYSKSLDKIVVVFRGTVDIKNWIEDLSYNQVQYDRCKNCRIHEGFYLSYLAIRSQLQKGIDTLQNIYSNKRIIVLGSSLGAALAMVGATQIQLKYRAVDQLHTFGCPRVGNQQFAMFVKSRLTTIYRVVHNRDIVPHVPLQSQNFIHPPLQVLYDEEMSSFKICNESGEDPSCSNAYYPYFNPQDHVTYWTKLNVHDICN